MLSLVLTFFYYYIIASILLHLYYTTITTIPTFNMRFTVPDTFYDTDSDSDISSVDTNLFMSTAQSLGSLSLSECSDYYLNFGNDDDRELEGDNIAIAEGYWSSDNDDSTIGPDFATAVDYVSAFDGDDEDSFYDVSSSRDNLPGEYIIPPVVVTVTPSPPLRRSTRIRRKPVRFADEYDKYYKK